MKIKDRRISFALEEIKFKYLSKFILFRNYSYFFIEQFVQTKSYNSV